MAKLKVKIGKLCASDPTGRALFIESLRAVRKQALPARTFYWLNKISQVVETEFADYEQARVKLVKELGEEQAGGGWRVKAEHADEFQKQLAAIDHEIELPVEADVKLVLPVNGVPDDWFMLMSELDIFAEPA